MGGLYENRALKTIVMTLMPAILLLSGMLPFHTVSIDANNTLIAGFYSFMTGFTFSAADQTVTLPPNILLIAIAALLCACLVLGLFSIFRDSENIIVIYAAAGIVLTLLVFSQLTYESVFFCYNNDMPRAVKELYLSRGNAGFVCLFLFGSLMFFTSVFYLLRQTERGRQFFDAFAANPVRYAGITILSLIFFCFLFGFKKTTFTYLDTALVTGVSFLTGFRVTHVQTVYIPPNIFILLSAILLALYLTSLFALKSSRFCRVRLFLSTTVLLALIVNPFAEMYTLGEDPAMPAFIHAMFNGGYTLIYFAVILFVFILTMASALEYITVVKQRLGKAISQHAMLYLFMLPGLILFLLFAYLPMFGIVMSFQSFDPIAGFFKSPWAGLGNFRTIFQLPAFISAFFNTLFISSLRIVFTFPLPILFALLLNEIMRLRFKKAVQSISYLPNFISWVIVSGIFYQMLSPDSGVINDVLMKLHIIGEPVYFMQSKTLFYPIIILTDIWKNLGFSSILYMASISAIDQELYEAASIDRANRFQMALYVTLPGMKSTILLLFILAISGLLNAGFDQLWTMSNPSIQSSAEILDTLVLRFLTRGSISDLSLGAAMGLFKAVLGLILFITANLISRKLTDESLI